MRKIKSNVFNSPDGVVEPPDQGHVHHFGDEMGSAVDAGAPAER